MDPDTEELDKYINDLADIKDEEPTQPVGDDHEGDDDGDDVPVDGSPDDLTEQDTADDKQDAPRDQNQQSNKGKKGSKDKSLRPIGDGLYADAAGNLYDNQRRMIAQGGFVNRVQTTNRRLKAQNEDLLRQVDELGRQFADFRGLTEAAKNYNLTTEDLTQALDFAGRMKRGDHVGVAKDLLAIIVAQGYNVTDLLGADVGDSIETKAIRHMIDERLAPITREEEARRSREDAERRGRAAYEQFVSDNEYADVHADAIVKLMNAEGVKPQQAYIRLREFAARHRLDFTQPLEPQVAELAKRDADQPPVRREQKPMPNGAATRFNGDASPALMDSPETDWGTIISRAQQSVGGA